MPALISLGLLDPPPPPGARGTDAFLVPRAAVLRPRFLAKIETNVHFKLYLFQVVVLNRYPGGGSSS